VRVWDVNTNQEVRQFAVPGGSAYGLGISPDGRYLMVGTGERVLILDLNSGQIVRQLVSPQMGELVYATALSADGRLVLTGNSGGTARLWDIASGAEIREFSTGSGDIFTVTFSPDGSKALTGSGDSTVRLWDTATGAELREFDNNGVVQGAAFSPDGQRIVTSSTDATARVWDAASGAELLRLNHPATVPSVAFSPDGRFIATGGIDSIVRLWDAA